MERTPPTPPEGDPKYKVTELFSNLTGESLHTWYRDDKLFFVTSSLIQAPNAKERFRIVPSSNDPALYGHIDFTKLYFDDFGQAITVMGDLQVGPNPAV
jgi:hypothetical protein